MFWSSVHAKVYVLVFSICKSLCFGLQGLQMSMLWSSVLTKVYLFGPQYLQMFMVWFSVLTKIYILVFNTCKCLYFGLQYLQWSILRCSVLAKAYVLIFIICKGHHSIARRAGRGLQFASTFLAGEQCELYGKALN